VQSAPNTTLAVLDPAQLSVREQNITKSDTHESSIHLDTSKPPSAVLEISASETNNGSSQTYFGHSEPLASQQIFPEGTKGPSVVQSAANTTLAVLDPAQLSVREQNITKSDKNTSNIHSDTSEPPSAVLEIVASETNNGSSQTYTGHSEPHANQQSILAASVVHSVPNTTLVILEPTQLTVKEQNTAKLEGTEHLDLTKLSNIHGSDSNETKIPAAASNTSNIMTQPDATKSPTYGMENKAPEPSKMPNIEQSMLELSTNHASTQSDSSQDNVSHR
jgi:hypothetical protein